MLLVGAATKSRVFAPTRANSRTIHHKLPRCSYSAVMSERAPGRPQEFTDRITKAVRLDPELNQRLKEEARRRNVSANLLINAAVEDYLNRLIPLDEVLRTG